MINNDVLRRIRYIFDYDDDKMIDLFAQADCKVTREHVCDWLKQETDPDFQTCDDRQMATFLNGLINARRGRREGPQPVPEDTLNNNMIFMKLRIALDMKSEDVLALLEKAGFSLSKHELTAFFRKPGHKHYKECKDQVLRNFLKGLQLQHRGNVELQVQQVPQAHNIWKQS